MLGGLVVERWGWLPAGIVVLTGAWIAVPSLDPLHADAAWLAPLAVVWATVTGSSLIAFERLHATAASHRSGAPSAWLASMSLCRRPAR